jgi:hypothetical protein
MINNSYPLFFQQSMLPDEPIKAPGLIKNPSFNEELGKRLEPSWKILLGI